MLLYVHRNRKAYCGRGGEPRTATSTFTQLLSSAQEGFVSVLFYIHKNHKAYSGRGARAASSSFTQLLSSAQEGW